MKSIQKIISFVNSKGGVGKTTSAICLSMSPKIADKKTLLIDASQDANLSAYHQATDKKNNLFSFIFGKSKDKFQFKTINTGIDLIPASIKTADDYLFKDNDVLEKKLAPLPYSIILIDTQPTFGNLTRACIMASTHVIIPVSFDLWDIESASVIAGNIMQMKKDVQIYILPTKFKKFNYRSKRILKLIHDLKFEVLNPINFYRKASDISYYGKVTDKKIIKNYEESFKGLL